MPPARASEVYEIVQAIGSGGRRGPPDQAATMYNAVGISGCEPPQPHFEVPGDERGPAHFQSSPEFFVGHVQVALRLLNARVSEPQLNDPDVDTVREQATHALVVTSVHLIQALVERVPAGAGQFVRRDPQRRRTHITGC